MAARTFAQLKAAVQDEGYGTDTATQQGNFINAEYKQLAGKRRWKWLEAVDSTTTTLQGTANYTPSIAYRTLDAVRIVDALGTPAYLEPMNEQDLLDLLRRDTGSGIFGTPRYWTLYAGQIYLWPIPDNVYRLTLYYIRNVTTMVADGDTHLVPEEYDGILVWGAVARMAMRQRDWLSRTFALQERDPIITAMSAEDGLWQRHRSDTVEDRLWGAG